MSIMKRNYKTYVLKLKGNNPKKELEFEIDFQSSLTTRERFEMMFKKSNQIKELLFKNGHRKTFEVIKRI
jgi:hypothetical protein